MPGTGYPFQMAGGVPVVAAPAEIDATNAGELRAILCEWQGRGHVTVVVDMTGTQFCDSTGLRELVWAHKRAVAEGGGLRLVVPAEGPFLRVFTVTGLDRVIPHFATLKQVLTQIPAAAARPMRRGPLSELAAEPARVPAHIRENGGPVTDGRSCEQCGEVFVPKREHARFCSSDCRPHHREDLRPGRAVPHAHRRGRGIHHGYPSASAPAEPAALVRELGVAGPGPSRLLAAVQRQKYSPGSSPTRSLPPSEDVPRCRGSCCTGSGLPPCRPPKGMP